MDAAAVGMTQHDNVLDISLRTPNSSAALVP